MRTSNGSLIYRDCLYYLRGLLKISLGKLIDGLNDLYLIDSIEIFPKLLLNLVIIPSLSPNLKEKLFEESFYIGVPNSRKFDNNEVSFMRTISLDSSSDHEGFIDLRDFDLTEFCEKLEELDIRLNSEVIQRLYEALTIESTKLNGITFYLFIDYWFLKEEELQKMDKYLPRNKLRTMELVLKISSQSHVTNRGIGRIVMTEKSVYQLQQGTNKAIKLVDIKNIETIEKTKAKGKTSFNKPALKLLTTINESIELCLGNERDIWYLSVKELWSANVIFSETKDALILNSSAQNVKILNAVIGSLTDDPNSRDSDKVETIASTVCYYTYLLDNDDINDKLRGGSVNLLHLRINASGKNIEKNTIESIISVDFDDCLTVWCAVGNRIKIFDSNSWAYEISEIKIKEKISCMSHEQNNQKIWVGTFDKCLYVIDILTRSFEKRIDAHNDIIVSIEKSISKNWLLSSSSSGEIIFWDIDKFEIIKTVLLKAIIPEFKKIIISLQIHSNKIILTTQDQIIIFDEEFNFQHSLVLENKSSSELLSTSQTQTCLQISCSCICKIDNTNFIWVSCKSLGFIWIWDLDSFELKMRTAVEVDESNGFRTLIQANNKIWAGSKNGKISVFCAKTFEHEKSINAHKDTIRSICLVNNRFVVSGSGSKDGTIAIWKTENISKAKTLKSAMQKILDSREPSLSDAKFKRRVSLISNKLI